MDLDSKVKDLDLDLRGEDLDLDLDSDCEDLTTSLQERHLACKKLHVGLSVVTVNGALARLRAPVVDRQLSIILGRIKSRLETYYHLTQLVLENGGYVSVVVVVLRLNCLIVVF